MEARVELPALGMGLNRGHRDYRYQLTYLLTHLLIKRAHILITPIATSNLHKIGLPFNMGYSDTKQNINCAFAR